MIALRKLLHGCKGQQSDFRFCSASINKIVVTVIIQSVIIRTCVKVNKMWMIKEL